jgi:hypothetical protein
MITDFKPYSRSSKVEEYKAGMPGSKFANLVKSLLHNIGVVIVGFGVGYLGVAADSLVAGAGSIRWRQPRRVACYWLPAFSCESGPPVFSASAT